MAPKRKAPPPSPQDPPSASSSEEEEEEGDDEQQREDEKVEDQEENDEEEEEETENEEEGDDEQQQQNEKVEDQEENDEEEETENEEEEEKSPEPNLNGKEQEEEESDDSPINSSGSDFRVQTIISKRVELEEDKENRSSLASVKRLSKVEASPSRKKSKNEEVSEKKSEEDLKKKFFQRKWSEDDEIVILEGLIDYAKKGDDLGDYSGFLGSIKKSLHFDANRDQLKLKIRKLKKKFETISQKAKVGEDPVFAKPHDQKLYGLWKEIQGGGRNGDVKKVKKKKIDDSVKKIDKGGNSNCVGAECSPILPLKMNKESASLLPLWNDLLFSDRALTRVLPGLGNSSIVKEGMNLLGSSKVKELELKWREVQVSEMEVYLKKTEFIQELGKKILNALKSS